MQLDRVRKVVSYVVFIARRWSPVDSKAREEELMRAVLEFGRMRSQLYKTDVTVVDATEIAFRFRETMRSVTRALTLLEQRGLVERTDLPRLWKLNGTGLQQSDGFSTDSPEGMMGDSQSCGLEKQQRQESGAISTREDPCRAST
jgi:hypothetical protein